MGLLARLLLGAACGTLTSGVTYAITTDQPWWWAVGLTVAVLIWFGELIWDVFS
ncbi:MULTISPECIES: hypothetical protein [unclassified Streptomyces]|uniref:hypothetical protein n=1 Tax=unclassified Streptomyces TaxID=2593676 RepID=UPI000A89E99A|nr:hypothetical protein [Streptomyces sp. TSRI0281]